MDVLVWILVGGLAGLGAGVGLGLALARRLYPPVTVNTVRLRDMDVTAWGLGSALLLLMDEPRITRFFEHSRIGNLPEALQGPGNRARWDLIRTLVITIQALATMLARLLIVEPEALEPGSTHPSRVYAQTFQDPKKAEQMGREVYRMYGDFLRVWNEVAVIPPPEQEKTKG